MLGWLFLQAGFRFHHAEPNYLMLVNWIPNTPDTLPANASHRVAIGAFVINANREVILLIPLGHSTVINQPFCSHSYCHPFVLMCLNCIFFLTIFCIIMHIFYMSFYQNIIRKLIWLFDRCLWFKKAMAGLVAKDYGSCLLEPLMKYVQKSLFIAKL